MEVRQATNGAGSDGGGGSGVEWLMMMMVMMVGGGGGRGAKMKRDKKGTRETVRNQTKPRALGWAGAAFSGCQDLQRLCSLRPTKPIRLAEPGLAGEQGEQGGNERRQ